MFRAMVAPLALLLAVGACDREPVMFEVTGRFPHDPRAYTQGLVRSDSVLFESTGTYGNSQIRRVDLQSGRVLEARSLAANRFGEGLALLNGRLYQLTWQSRVAYVFDAATLALLDSVSYPGEGWGLATDGTFLIMSDGSDSLRFLSPETFQVQKVVHVRYQGASLSQVNELEYINGELLANIYQTNRIARIDPNTGNVTELLDFSALFPDRPATADVLNGIATAPDSGQLLLTGKYWPTMFQVRLLPPGQSR